MEENQQNNPENNQPPQESQDELNHEQTPQNVEPPTPEQTLPQSDLADQPDKNACLWATFSHLASFAGILGIPFGSILGPLVIWLIKRAEIPFVDQCGKEAVNFQISIGIYFVAATPHLRRTVSAFGLDPSWHH